MEELKLSESELKEIYSESEFYHNFIKNKNVKELDGSRIWVSGFKLSQNKLVGKLKRNQPPLELVMKYSDEKRQLEFFSIRGDGELGKRFDLFFTPYYSHHVGYNYEISLSKTEKQAQYAYNQHIEEAIKELDKKAKEIELKKQKIQNMKL